MNTYVSIFKGSVCWHRGYMWSWGVLKCGLCSGQVAYGQRISLNQMSDVHIVRTSNFDTYLDTNRNCPTAQIITASLLAVNRRDTSGHTTVQVRDFSVCRHDTLTAPGFIMLLLYKNIMLGNNPSHCFRTQLHSEIHRKETRGSRSKFQPLQNLFHFGHNF